MTHGYDVNKYADFWELVEAIDSELLPVVKAPEIWSIADVVDHMVDAEIQSYLRFRSVLFDPVPIIANHDEQAWQEAGRRHFELAEAKALIGGIRRANLALLDGCDEGALERTGMHTTAGRIGLGELVAIYDAHVETHRLQVVRLLANLGG